MIVVNYLITIFSMLFMPVLGSISLPNIVEEEHRPALNGRICAYGDFNKDRYTDLLVQRDGILLVLAQSEQGVFTEAKIAQIVVSDWGNVFCSVGDFDGDAGLDILVTRKIETTGLYKTTTFLYTSNNFSIKELNATFAEQPTIMDINGDGMSDIVGFVGDSQKKSLFCLAGHRDGVEHFTDCKSKFADFNEDPYPLFAPMFVDVSGDLGAEVVFGMKSDTEEFRLDVWKLINENYHWSISKDLSPNLPENSNQNFHYFGSAVVSDFNADSVIDILIPVCHEAKCNHVTHFLILSKGKWIVFQIDLKDSELVTDENSNILFRVGDFSLDGFPDLVATVKYNSKVMPMILENVENPDNANFNRRFELRTSHFYSILPAGMSGGILHLSAFFDLKEDGNLDILVEYWDKNEQKPKIDFIKCDDKGDTTFLKVQIFSNVCTNDCPNQSTRSADDIGSGITWHGACVSFTMSDSWGGDRVSIQCQLPQTSHRALYSPFALFGLGRSPNFVDHVLLGSPRWTERAENQHSILKQQIVPNSRILVVPPEADGTHWQSRLYLTPNRLIIQSILVLASVCGILLLLAVILHFRERRQDRKERQAQTHRFHFDAM